MTQSDSISSSPVRTAALRAPATRTKLLLEGPILSTLLRLAAPNVLNLLAFVGVIVFAGLTVYDAQRLKELAFATNAGPTTGTTIVGALALYLDFINLFLFLLRFVGNRRDDW